MRVRWLGLVILLSWLGVPAGAQQPKGNPGGLQFHRTEHFDMFAPSKEIAVAKEEMVEAAAQRFIALMGKAGPRGALVLADPQKAQQQWADQRPYYKHGAKWVLPWYAHHPMGENLWPAYGRTNQIGGGDPLPHEAAHLMFVFVVNSGCCAALKQKFNGYGSYLPDWLDEGIAIYVEHQAIRDAQRELMADNLDERIPLAEFFAMDHPGAPKIGGKPNPAAGHGFAGGFDRARIYYMECVTALEFLEAAAGAEGVRKIIKTLQGGSKMDKAIKHLPAHYPQDLDGLEEVWVEWIRTGELPPAPDPPQTESGGKIETK